MSRTNIEEQAWVRIYRLAEFVGCSVREAAGTAACLWHQSQSLVKATGSKEDILEWASLHNCSESEREKWLVCLKKARIVSETNSAEYLINGNEIQIESSLSNIKRASKGGQALKKKLRELKSLKAGLKQSSRGLQDLNKTPKSDQINAIQVSANQNNSKQGKSDHKITKTSKNPAEPPKANAFVAAYCDRFKLRWGDNPDPLGKDIGILKRLAKALTLEKFETYLDAYFQMPDASILKARHPINLFELKFNEVMVFAKTGNFTTTRQAQQADDFASNMLLLNQVRGGK